jgi:hypothetical protein
MNDLPERRSYQVFENWIQAMGAAWEARDKNSFAQLFTENAHYYWTPFDQVLAGRDQIGGAVGQAFANQQNIKFRYNVIDWSDRAGTAHWRCTFDRDGKQIIVDGILRAIIDEDGFCEEFKEWWHSTE